MEIAPPCPLYPPFIELLEKLQFEKELKLLKVSIPLEEK